MKKQLFLVVVAALAMASCSKDESTGINNGNAIDFRAASSEAARWSGRPKTEAEARHITREQLTMLLSGIDFFKAHQSIQYSAIS